MNYNKSGIYFVKAMDLCETIVVISKINKFKSNTLFRLPELEIQWSIDCSSFTGDRSPSFKTAAPLQ